LIDREREMVTFPQISKFGFAPKLFGRFLNGYVYGFFDGKVMREADIRQPDIQRSIAAHMAKWHAMDVSTPDKEPCYFRVLNDWISKLPAAGVAIGETTFLPAQLKSELAELEKMAVNWNSPIVFSHNDLLAFNVIQRPSGAMAFIDYEYAAYNWRGYDIANHFCEYCGFDWNLDQHPDREMQKVFVEAYLKAASTVAPSEGDVEDLLGEIDRFEPLSNLWWGIWALIQSENSDLDFEFAPYGKKRLDRYFELQAKRRSL
jgi:ethanolamine kinase